MATKTVVKRSGSRIRFVMLEADLADGDLTEITQAISSALKQSSPAQRLIAAPARPDAEGGKNGAGVVDEVEQEAEVEEEVEETPRSAKGKGAKFSNPKVLPDVDLNSGEMPFETFAQQKGPPAKELQRYLLVAYWFKKYRETPSVTQDHVYTCYKTMEWGTAARDFVQPLRDLAKAGRGEFNPPNFTINHVGENIVEKKMKPK
jgi:hypothetical protein